MSLPLNEFSRFQNPPKHNRQIADTLKNSATRTYTTDYNIAYKPIIYVFMFLFIHHTLLTINSRQIRKEKQTEIMYIVKLNYDLI